MDKETSGKKLFLMTFSSTKKLLASSEGWKKYSRGGLRANEVRPYRKCEEGIGEKDSSLRSE